MNILLNHVLWGLLVFALAWACFMIFDALVKAYRRYKGDNIMMCFETRINKFFSIGWDDEYSGRLGLGWNHVSIWFYCHGYYFGFDR